MSRQISHSTRRCALALIAIAGCHGESRSPEDAPPGAPPDPAPPEVTLLTGDRVTITKTGQVRMQAGAGRASIGFLTQRVRGETIVIPRDVAPLIAAGRVDRDLFNITKLVAEGHDDAQRDDLPVVVTGHADTPAARGRLATRGIIVDRTMPALGAIAARQRKSAPNTLLAELAATPSQKLWFDRRYKPLLDRSVAQIGAPAAWASHYTGAGVTVAVLDTGVDVNHPDLAGKVADFKTFETDGLGDSDVVGHGTHVASIIAGSGAASLGVFRGTAPDATLISGRVCRPAGCPLSAILAGVEWAAVTKQAQIVNLSIGAFDGAELDPLEEAVNRLSAEHGTLFVVAAGNDGEFGPRTLSSPGTAEAALTVGAIDRDEQIAPFSSRGPRRVDSGAKPDITAPGVGIAAARAAVMPDDEVEEPVGTAYLRLSGTSMATPHVAGAAALLLQQHPDWTGEQVKAALMASAIPNAALTPFDQGAGRVDVTRAIRQEVVARPASVSFGIARWPHGDDPLLRRTVTYHNTGAAPVTLAISGALSHAGVPATGMLTISPPSITVPAGGSADVIATVDTTGDRPDVTYSGALVATAPGDVRIVTPLAVDREVPSSDVTIHVLDSNGDPADAFGALLVNWSEGQEFRPPATLRLRHGLYTIWAIPDHELLSLVYPRLHVSGDATVVLDGRQAHPIEPSVIGRDLEITWTEATYADRSTFINFAAVEPGILRTGTFGPDAPAGEVHALATVQLTPRGAPDDPTVYLFGRHERDRHLSGWSEAIPADRLATVCAKHLGEPQRSYDDYFSSLLQGFEGTFGMPFFNVGGATFQGAYERTRYHYGAGVEWLQFIAELGVASAGFVPAHYENGRRYVERWNRAPFGPAYTQGNGPQRLGDTITIWHPSTYSENAVPSRAGSIRSNGGNGYRFTRDGKPVNPDGAHLGLGPLPVPPQRATYRIDDGHDQTEHELSTRVRVTWLFESEHVPGTEPLVIPVPTMRFAPELDDQNRAPRKAPLLLPTWIERLPGAPRPDVTNVSVEASFDDGATWSTVFGVRIGALWLGLVFHPADATYVSLRGSAKDVEGNSVDQEIIRAYKLAP